MTDSDIVGSFEAGIGPSLHTPYTEVHALLISWADNDFGKPLDDEITNLRAVLENEYNYSSVTTFSIPTENAHRRLNREISSFVEDYSSSSDSLIIIYYGGHCGPNSKNAKEAEWAAFEDEDRGPSLLWLYTQGLLFAARGDVLLILDCCHAALLCAGLKSDGGRFELVAACGKASKTPIPGRLSFTNGLIRILKRHVHEGITSQSLASVLREDSKITETPVFHDFVRQYPTHIRLQPLPTLDAAEATNGFIQKPSGYLLFRASLSGDVTGLQIAQWLKAAPPDYVTAVSIEAIVSRARRMQTSTNLVDGCFPPGSMFEALPAAARAEIVRCMRNLNTVMAVTGDLATSAEPGEELVSQTLNELEDASSSVAAAIETPLLAVEPSNVDSSGIIHASRPIAEATDLIPSLVLREAILSECPTLYSTEIALGQLTFNNNDPSRFKFGTFSINSDGSPTLNWPIMAERYNYADAANSTGDPCPKALSQIRKMTGLLCHPKRKGFHIMPCLGFYRDRVRRELGLVFRPPPSRFDLSQGQEGFTTLLDLLKSRKLVPLGERIHLAWALAVAVEHLHRVGWVHKSFRSSIIGFVQRGREDSSSQETADSKVVVEQPGEIKEPLLDDEKKWDLTCPYLFGYEYARPGDGTTYLDEDHTLANNIYRHPERWGMPSAKFEKKHDAYALGVVLLEIALWKDVQGILKVRDEKVRAEEIAEALRKKYETKTLPHQIGGVFVGVIMTCLVFGERTKGMSDYEAQVFFQREVTRRLKGVVGKI
ncbi:hypothetical protein V8F06_013341 [Rhypophila decipiens]